MSISLKGHVVVLDEAHNMEDCSREAASCLLSGTMFREAEKDLDKLANFNRDLAQDCQACVRFFFKKFLEEKKTWCIVCIATIYFFPFFFSESLLKKKKPGSGVPVVFVFFLCKHVSTFPLNKSHMSEFIIYCSMLK